MSETMDIDHDPPSPVLHSAIPSVFAESPLLPPPTLSQSQSQSHPPSQSTFKPPTLQFRCAACRRRFPGHEEWDAHRKKYRGRCAHIRRRRESIQDRTRRPSRWVGEKPRERYDVAGPGVERPSQKEDSGAHGVSGRHGEGSRRRGSSGGQLGSRNSRQTPLFTRSDSEDSDYVVWVDHKGQEVPHIPARPGVKAEPESDDELRDIVDVGAPTPEMRRPREGHRGHGSSRPSHEHCCEHCAHGHRRTPNAHDHTHNPHSHPQHSHDSRPRPGSRPCQRCDSEGPRYAAGRGSKVLSAEVRANILGTCTRDRLTPALLLGRYGGRTPGPGAHIRSVTGGELDGWEAITAAVGARPQDAERVRHCAKGFIADLPAMIKRGR